MAVYIMLTRLTEHGAKTVKQNPGRILEVDRQLGDMGLEIIDQYAVLGSYDFVNVVEAPDDQAIARISLELASRGSIRIETMRAIPINELVEGLQAPATAAAGR